MTSNKTLPFFGGGDLESPKKSTNNKNKKKIVFVTNSRADYGKLKPLMKALKDLSPKHPLYNQIAYRIFVCGMHLLEKYGNTYIEILKDGFEHVFLSKPYENEIPMDFALANTITQFSSFIAQEKPDLIIVHGDRIESLACAIVASFNNILCAHIEGGEVSGTLDESIRHSVSKLAHLHYVCNQQAERNLIQMGEKMECIFNIGSSDIDAMLGDLPDFEEVERYYYQIKRFNRNYAILIYHPVVSETIDLPKHVFEVLEGVKASLKNFVVIYPNNDLGSNIILKALEGLKGHDRFIAFPSMRFEYFLTLLKNAQFIIGNSSCGIREAGVYGVPCINCGTRQHNRSDAKHIINVKENKDEIYLAIKKVHQLKSILKKSSHFGQGDSAKRFLASLNLELFDTPTQKSFVIREVKG
ncbi:UDP-N-acetylglucosamine 2-epimerase [Helicobacter acinonychis]|uniref:UDP-N-acetylglucosamine 2-epimerase n=1 Tax=Helicobacter acinonychis TaxID=212 RepID=UPI000CF11C10|nr:UDP-N-acetylglucosamine 2-epimerase [Helicobacter acinonychis]STP03853.1 UDP-N-acetylglucosamine 2-epimerase [Helicobacter acinonychis]